MSERVLDPTFDLSGTTLVEASAGTGKTHTIASLYLSLVAVKGMAVQQILVVTFTEAATKELRDRLRVALAGLADPRKANDERIKELRALANAKSIAEQEVRRRIRRALLDFDEAAIYTIHGFCQRVLRRYAVECGAPLDAELVTDASGLILVACEDWWRRHAYDASPDRLKLLRAIGCGLGQLRDLAGKRAAKPEAEWRPACDTTDFEGVVASLSGVLGKIDHTLQVFLDLPACKGHDGYAPNAEAKRFQQKAQEAHAAITTQSQAPERATRLGLELLAMIQDEKKHPTWQRSWDIPQQMQTFLAACSTLADLIKGRHVDKFAWDGNRLVHPKIDGQQLRQAIESLRTAWNNGAGKQWDIIRDDLTSYPAKDNKKASAAKQTVASLNDWLTHPGEGKDPAFVKNIAALVDFPKDYIAHKDYSLGSLPCGAGQVLLPLLVGLKDLHTHTFALMNRAIEEICGKYRAAKLAVQSITFDDLLLDLRRALTKGDEAARARVLAAIHGEYAAALIDEFQDTDPVQYEIFSTIFGGDRPLFLVGDPKQAIYGFRSGDIFTYRAAADKVESRPAPAAGGAGTGTPSPPALDGPHKVPLDTNRRSEKNLVDSINQLFRDRGGATGHTFIYDWIAYPGILKAKGRDAAQCLYVNGAIDATPFRLWYYTGGNGSTPGQYSAEAEKIYADVADEVVCILNDEAQQIGPSGRRVRCSDIAILVHTHKEAGFISHELRRRKVPVVQQKLGNVFDTTEAADMALLMAAMAAPHDATCVRSALACCVMGLEEEKLKQLVAGKAIPISPLVGDAKPECWALEKWMEFFDELHETWSRRSFIEAFNRLTEKVGLRTRVMAAKDGERRLTNLVHLADLAHRAIGEGGLSIEATLAWLTRQRNSATQDASEDEIEMRLETDDDAVKIMTIFKSKGLQFPIVFVPTLWRKKPQQSLDARGGRIVALEYHDETAVAGAGSVTGSAQSASPAPLVVNLEIDCQAGMEQHLKERLAEDIRLLYVACTRAINRTYLVWGNFANNPGESALAYVLGAGMAGDGSATRIEQVRKRLQEELPPGANPAIKVEEKTLSAGEAAVVADSAPTPPPDPADGSAPAGVAQPSAGPQTGDPVCYKRESSLNIVGDFQTEDQRSGKEPGVDKDHGHASFSSLVPREKKAMAGSGVPDKKDHDSNDGAEWGRANDPVPAVVPGSSTETPALSILTFPAGAWTGECWHSIFELLDFGANDDQIREVVKEQLAAFRLDKGLREEICEEKRKLVTDMVRSVLELDLPVAMGDPGKRTFKLKTIAAADRRSELEFHFALPDIGDRRTPAILECIENHWENSADPGKKQLRDLLGKNWDREIPRGFMTGSIDLVFRKDGRYYIVDWKSNRRQVRPEDFDVKGLQEEMAAHAYYLQYLIYTVAVHQYLRGSLAGYAYNKHFGGVFYLFLRGTSHPDTHGVYADRPSQAMIEDLSKILGDFS